MNDSTGSKPQPDDDDGQDSDIRKQVLKLASEGVNIQKIREETGVSLKGICRIIKARQKSILGGQKP